MLITHCAATVLHLANIILLLELTQESLLSVTPSFLTCSLQKVKKKNEEGEEEDNEMLLHDMSITVIHFM